MNNAADIISKVINFSPDTDTRVCRRIEPGVRVHQGDIYVHRVADDYPRAELWGSRQVAVGSTIGQRHVAEGPVEVFHSAGPADSLLTSFNEQQRQACTGPVVVATDTWTLTHPEHAHHVLPAGTYVVTYQWSEALQRRVED